MKKKKLVVLTGAGISAESGLKTFRDSDGLWEGYDVTEVATPRAWRANPQLVLDFYNMRRKDVGQAAPNAAHIGLAELEKDFDGALGKVQLASERLKFPLWRLSASAYVTERVALVGDAAHVVHPLAGQGANLGLLDAAALADVLAEGLKAREDPGAIRLLRRYERWRRSENDLMSGAIDVFDRLLARGTGRLATFAQRGMPWVNRSTLAKRVFIERAMGLAGELPAAAR